MPEGSRGQASSLENSASESPYIRVAARPSGTTETRPSTRPPCAALAARARTRMRRGEPAERPRAAAAGGSPSDDDDQLHRILTRRSSGGLRELRSRCSSLCAQDRGVAPYFHVLVTAQWRACPLRARYKGTRGLDRTAGGRVRSREAGPGRTSGTVGLERPQASRAANF